MMIQRRDSIVRDCSCRIGEDESIDKNDVTFSSRSSNKIIKSIVYKTV